MESKVFINATDKHRLGNFSADFRYSHPTDSPSDHCQTGALTDGLGLFVQLLLAVIAFSCLIAKRYCEPSKNRRSWKIWFLDTSKQIIGAGAMHTVNVLLSEILYSGDPCTWYVVNFLLDSTIGLAVIYVGLKVAFCFGRWMHWGSLRYGEYGEPPRIAVWAKQCLAYLFVILVEKAVITLLTLINFWKKVTRNVMGSITNATVEVVLVMFIIPLVINAIIFWVVDNFLMQHKRDGFSSDAAEASSQTSVCRFCCCQANGRSEGTALPSAAKYKKLREYVHSAERTGTSEAADDSEVDAFLPASCHPEAGQRSSKQRL